MGFCRVLCYAMLVRMRWTCCTFGLWLLFPMAAPGIPCRYSGNPPGSVVVPRDLTLRGPRPLVAGVVDATRPGGWRSAAAGTWQMSRSSGRRGASRRDRSTRRRCPPAGAALAARLCRGACTRTPCSTLAGRPSAACRVVRPSEACTLGTSIREEDVGCLQ